jgi:signal transduction histidine kinase
MPRKGQDLSQSDFWLPSLRIAAIYLAMGVLWILFSDRAVDSLQLPPKLLTQVQSTKGLGYVIVTTGLLCLLIYRTLATSSKMEQKIRAGEQIRDLVAIQSSVGVIEWNSNRECIHASPALTVLTEIEERDMLGMNYVKTLSLTSLDPVFPTEEEAELSRPKYSQLKLLDHSGMPMTLQMTVAALMDEHRVIGYAGTITDVTSLTNAAEELERRVVERTRQLNEANESLSSFAYAVAHDLRAPIRSVTGFARILREESKELTEDAADALDRIEVNAEKMQQIVSGLLSLAQVDTKPLETQFVDISAIFRRILERETQALPNRAIEWHVQQGMAAQADPSLVEVLAQNLIDNAIKFTKEREKAVITVGLLDVPGVFYVRDNGIGFDQEDAVKIFTPFKSVADRRKYPGTGIGLSTVARVVNRHGGRVEAIGKPSQGAEFRFTLDSTS